jgi:L-ornithine N5-oxygenase
VRHRLPQPRPADPPGELTEHCARLPGGTPAIDRDYRVVTSAHVQCGIYVQGATEHTHGLSSTLLSTTAVRAGEITRFLAGSARRPAGSLR